MKGEDDGVVLADVLVAPSAGVALGVVSRLLPNADGLFVGVLGTLLIAGEAVLVSEAAEDVSLACFVSPVALLAEAPNGVFPACEKAAKPAPGVEALVLGPPKADGGLAVAPKDVDPKEDCPNPGDPNDDAPNAGLVPKLV